MYTKVKRPENLQSQRGKLWMNDNVFNFFNLKRF